MTIPIESGRTRWRQRLSLTLSLGLAVSLTALWIHGDAAAGDSRKANGSGPAGIVGVMDLENRPVDPFATNDDKAVVFIFVSNECPISNRYAPEVRRLFERFRTNGVRFWLVHPDPDETVESIRKHTVQYGYPMGVLRDPKHELVRRSQARVTPEAAVFLPGGRLVYHGRIDDRYADLGKERSAPTRRDLQEVLEAIVRGDAVEPRSARGVGCYIPDGQ